MYIGLVLNFDQDARPFSSGKTFIPHLFNTKNLESINLYFLHTKNLKKIHDHRKRYYLLYIFFININFNTLILKNITNYKIILNKYILLIL